MGELGRRSRRCWRRPADSSPSPAQRGQGGKDEQGEDEDAPAVSLESCPHPLASPLARTPGAAPFEPSPLSVFAGQRQPPHRSRCRKLSENALSISCTSSSSQWVPGSRRRPWSQRPLLTTPLDQIHIVSTERRDCIQLILTLFPRSCLSRRPSAWSSSARLDWLSLQPRVLTLVLSTSLQAFYPERLVPSVLKALSRFYINISNDPAIQVRPSFELIISQGRTQAHARTFQGSLNLLGHRQEYIWMKSLLFVRSQPLCFARSLLTPNISVEHCQVEAVFQLPVFFIALYALWYDDRRFWVLLLIYGASTTTTLVPVLAVVLAAPSYASVKLAQVTLEQGQIALTSSERLVLLSSYLPFLFIPVSACLLSKPSGRGLLSSLHS